MPTAALAQPGASILPIDASAPSAPDVVQPSPEAIAARIRALKAQEGEAGNHPLPTIVMRRTGDGKQCSFSVLDGSYVNFHDAPYGCDDNIYNTFEVIGAHEGMRIEIEGAPNCNGSEAYASYIVSFGPGHGPVGNIAPTSVAASVGIPVGQILNDGSGVRAFIANGYKSSGAPLPNAVSCVMVRTLMPNGPYRYKNRDSGMCLRSDVDRPPPAQCIGPGVFSFYELNDYWGTMVPSESVADAANRKFLKANLGDAVLEISTGYDPTLSINYNSTTNWLRTIPGICATQQYEHPNEVRVHECRFNAGTRMQWIREPLPVR
ncbi:hypothetical protein A9762_09350 [Pandoraea sp. ISTKB]|nr:hypothetical protein A9762_09350 [Pandoraea sp. ISTKB]